MLKSSTFSAENFVRSLFRSISPPISEQFTVEMCAAAKNCQKSQKNYQNRLFWKFKFIQSYRFWYSRKARQQCWLRQSASVCLSATVFTLNRSMAVKWPLLGGIFDAFVRRECRHPATESFVTKNSSLCGRFRDPSLCGFDTIQQCDGRMDRETEGRTSL